MSQPSDFKPYVPMTHLDTLWASPDHIAEAILARTHEHFLGRIVSSLPESHLPVTPNSIPDPTDWPFCPFGSTPRNEPIRYASSRHNQESVREKT